MFERFNVGPVHPLPDAIEFGVVALDIDENERWWRLLPPKYEPRPPSATGNGEGDLGTDQESECLRNDGVGVENTFTSSIEFVLDEVTEPGGVAKTFVCVTSSDEGESKMLIVIADGS